MRGIGRARLIWGILGIAVLVASTVGVTLVASARSSSASAAPSVVTYPAVSGGVAAGVVSGGNPAVTGTGMVTTGSGSPAVSYPAWCCSGGNPIGLTATGQATVPGAGAAARALAVGRAIADAQSQARAAAAGAGITLGRIINVQVSVPYYPYAYPLPMGAASRAGGVSGAPATSACPVGSRCPYPAISIDATVTVTWAIG